MFWIQSYLSLECFSKSFHKGFRKFSFPPGYTGLFQLRRGSLKKFLSGSEDQLPISDQQLTTELLKKKKNPFKYLVRFQPGQTINISGNIEQASSKRVQKIFYIPFSTSYYRQRFGRADLGRNFHLQLAFVRFPIIPLLELPYLPEYGKVFQLILIFIFLRLFKGITQHFTRKSHRVPSTSGEAHTGVLPQGQKRGHLQHPQLGELLFTVV